MRGSRKEDSFRCVHCHALVSTHPAISGVQSRNHCPYCLWSRHVDDLRAGDRLAICQAPMQPLGLTVKKSRNKYGQGGELMLINRCLECGKLSINRIAADDIAERISALYEASLSLDAGTLAILEKDGIYPLVEEDRILVRRQLYGWKG